MTVYQYVWGIVQDMSFGREASAEVKDFTLEFFGWNMLLVIYS